MVVNFQSVRVFGAYEKDDGSSDVSCISEIYVKSLYFFDVAIEMQSISTCMTTVENIERFFLFFFR